MNQIKQICKDPIKVEQKLQGKEFLLGKYFSIKPNCNRCKKDKKFTRTFPIIILKNQPDKSFFKFSKALTLNNFHWTPTTKIFPKPSNPKFFNDNNSHSVISILWLIKNNNLNPLKINKIHPKALSISCRFINYGKGTWRIWYLSSKNLYYSGKTNKALVSKY